MQKLQEDKAKTLFHFKRSYMPSQLCSILNIECVYIFCVQSNLIKVITHVFLMSILCSNFAMYGSNIGVQSRTVTYKSHTLMQGCECLSHVNSSRGHNPRGSYMRNALGPPPHTHTQKIKINK